MFLFHPKEQCLARPLIKMKISVNILSLTLGRTAQRFNWAKSRASGSIHNEQARVNNLELVLDCRHQLSNASLEHGDYSVSLASDVPVSQKCKSHHVLASRAGTERRSRATLRRSIRSTTQTTFGNCRASYRKQGN